LKPAREHRRRRWPALAGAVGPDNTCIHRGPSYGRPGQRRLHPTAIPRATARSRSHARRASATPLH